MIRLSSIHPVRPVTLAALACVMTLGGCSTIGAMFSGDKVDYKNNASKTAPLDVPPDLTQLQRDGRYSPQGAVISANAYQPGTPGAAAAPGQAAAPAAVAMAPNQVGDVKVARDNSARWLVTTQTPEQLWPQLRAFFQDNGFSLDVDNPTVGVMETNWAENRAKIQKDFIRNAIGKVFDNAYSSDEQDKYRLRLERTPEGTEIYLTHQGLQEVTVGERREDTKWQPRAPDPQLENEMLTRLMVRLGTKEDAAKVQVAATTPTLLAATPTAAAAAVNASTGPAHARLLTDLPAATLQVDEPFDRAWRRVGLALDHSGFTVEDRDRANGVYYVRYADPKYAGQDEPGFFAKFFGKNKDSMAPARYRIEVQRGGTTSTNVSVMTSQGQPENGDIGKQIVKLLVEDLH